MGDITNIIDDEVDTDELVEMTDDSDISNGPVEKYLFTQEFLKELYLEIEEKFDKPCSAEELENMFDDEINYMTAKSVKRGAAGKHLLRNKFFEKPFALKTIGL